MGGLLLSEVAEDYADDCRMDRMILPTVIGGAHKRRETSGLAASSLFPTGMRFKRFPYGLCHQHT